VQELRALVEERRVVLVAFEDEVLTIAEAKAASEVFGDAADQKRGLKCSGFENPRQHRGRGRFAVRSGNHQNVFADQEFIVQNLRQRAERNAFVEQALQFDIAARECVAYDYEIRTGLRFVAAKGCATGMPRDSRNVDIGG